MASGYYNSQKPGTNPGTIPPLPGSIISPGNGPYNPGNTPQPGNIPSSYPGTIPQFPGGVVIPQPNPGTTTPQQPGTNYPGSTPQQPGTNYPGTTIPQLPGGSVVPQPNPGNTTPQQPGTNYPGTTIPQLPGGIVPQPNPGTTIPQQPGTNYPGTTIPQLPGGIVPQPNPGTTIPQLPGGSVIPSPNPGITPPQPGTYPGLLPNQPQPSTPSGPPSFRLFCAWQANMSVGIKNGKVVLVPDNPCDQYQNWIKDTRYNYRRDKEGHTAFALINKATGQAIRGHITDSAEEVKLVPHNPQAVDECILWTEGADLRSGFRPIRMLNRTDNWLAPADTHGAGDPFLGCWHYFRVPWEGIDGNIWRFSPR